MILFSKIKVLKVENEIISFFLDYVTSNDEIFDIFVVEIWSEFRGGGEGERTPFFDPLTKSLINHHHTLILLYDLYFRPTNPKIFLKAPLTPIYTGF